MKCEFFKFLFCGFLFSLFLREFANLYMHELRVED